jgi:hypothetical protein
MSNPEIDVEERQRLVARLMEGRRLVGIARRLKDVAGEADARNRVDVAKRALGERGPVWWKDDAPDLNRQMVRTTPYAEWYESLGVENVR